MATIESSVSVGTVNIICPVCETIIPVPVSATMRNPGGAWTGTATLDCEPDMTDLWAHMFTHDD